jgi:hypothetical protein
MNTTGANIDLEYFERCVGKSFATQLPAYESVWLKTGRLCQITTGDGKRPIFAIGNYVKQRLLYPVHDWAMRVLQPLPTDGTYKQEGPHHRLRALQSSNVYSFDRPVSN